MKHNRLPSCGGFKPVLSYLKENDITRIDARLATLLQMLKIKGEALWVIKCSSCLPNEFISFSMSRFISLDSCHPHEPSGRNWLPWEGSSIAAIPKGPGLWNDKKTTTIQWSKIHQL